MIALGYFLSVTYVLMLIFGIGPIVKRFSNVETSRKVIHILLFVVWIIIDHYLKDTIHQVIVPVIFIVLNSLSYKFKLYKSVEREDENHLGTIYFAIAITVILAIAYWDPKFYLPAGISVFCLTFGDGVAALIGYNVKSAKIKGNKSIAGFFACAVATFFSVFIYSNIYEVSLGLWGILLLSFITAILELVGKGLDNFSVCFGTFIISFYLVNFYSSALAWSITFAIAIFMIVFFCKAIDYYGSILAMTMVFSFSYFGKFVGLAYLLLTYFIIFFVSVIRKVSRRKANSSARTFKQILINGGIGTIFVILFGITDNPDFLIMCIVAIGGCFVDSIASDVGSFSKSTTYDLVRRVPVKKGLSGGVSLLGSIAAILASLMIGIYSYCFVTPNVFICLLIVCMCILQTTLDTILGSSIQVKYQCSACGEITERKEHCGKNCDKHSGIAWIDNNAVNAISSIAVSSISYLLISGV